MANASFIEQFRQLFPLNWSDNDATDLSLLRGFLDVSPSSDVVIKRAQRTLAHAQIIALPDTPIELIPAPGVGRAIDIIGGSMNADCRGGAYTGFSGYSALEVGIVGVTGTNTILPSAVLGNSGFTRAFMGVAPYYLIGTGDYDTELTLGAGADSNNDPADNQKLSIIGYNGANAHFASGHASNTLKVTVYYAITDV